MTESRTKKWWVSALLTAMLFPGSALMAQPFTGQPGEIRTDKPMLVDPPFMVPETSTTFHPRLLPLWMQALSQPDAQTRYQAALAIAKAQALGMPGLEITQNQLAVIAASKDEHAMTRLAAAKALVAMDAREHAEAIWAVSQDLGNDAMLVTGPALARWQHGPAVEAWRKQAADETLSAAVRRSAIESLAAARDAGSRTTLHALAVNAVASPALRLAAARTYGKVTAGDTGPLPELPKVSHEAGSIDNLVRAYLLTGHASDQARDQLVALLTHSDTTVASVAALALLEQTPDRLDASLDQLSQSGDAGLRQVAIRRWIGKADGSSIAGLVKRLGDAQPALRRQAGDGLIQLGESEALKDQVAQGIAGALQASDANVLEQASIAAGQLKLVATADRLVELLDHASREVGLAAAVALRRLQVTESLPGVLTNVQKVTTKDAQLSRDEQGSELIQLLGLMKYEPARETLLKLVPKNSGPVMSRQAAIWTLGHLHADNVDTALATQLMRRVNDNQGMEPEDDLVRYQSIIALGRMKATAQVGGLRAIAGGQDETSHIGAAARWSIGQITDTRPAEPPLSPTNVGGWFLEPTN